MALAWAILEGIRRGTHRVRGVIGGGGDRKRKGRKGMSRSMKRGGRGGDKEE